MSAKCHRRQSHSCWRPPGLKSCPALLPGSVERFPLSERCARRSRSILLRALGLESTDRGDDLLRAYDGAGVVWHVDVERGVHHLVRVIRRRVLHHGDVIAELSGIANGCFNASMRNEPDDDEFMDAVFLELQIQIGVSEAAGAPMLLD